MGDTIGGDAATTDTVGSFLAAVAAGRGIGPDLYSPEATLDATVPNWRYVVRGAEAIAAEYDNWFAAPAEFEELTRSTSTDGEVVTVPADLGRVRRSARCPSLPPAEAWSDDGRIESDVVFCGGRWPAGAARRDGSGDVIVPTVPTTAPGWPGRWRSCSTAPAGSATTDHPTHARAPSSSRSRSTASGASSSTCIRTTTSRCACRATSAAGRGGSGSRGLMDIAHRRHRPRHARRSAMGPKRLGRCAVDARRVELARPGRRSAGAGRTPPRASSTTARRMAAASWGWRDDLGLLPHRLRWQWFGPDQLAGERDLGFPEPVPRIAVEGWERFADRAPAALLGVVDELRRDATPLSDAALATPPDVPPRRLEVRQPRRRRSTAGRSSSIGPTPAKDRSAMNSPGTWR